MTKRPFLLPYNTNSKSVVGLVTNLRDMGGKIINVDKKSNFKPTADKVVINWGSRTEQAQGLAKVSNMLNPPSALEYCANKANFFNKMKEEGVQIPEFTTDPAEALNWCQEGIEVVGRTTLTGHSGEGILFSGDFNNDFETFVYGGPRLYVKYIKKLHEYRVHIFRGDIIDIQQKKLRATDDEGNRVDPDNIDFRVRTHTNGFIFARDAIQVPDCVKEVALSSYQAIPDLDFGAFDMIYNRHYDKAYVLECNTAPGLEGSTLDSYLGAFKNALNS